MKKWMNSLGFVGFLQALGLIAYCSLVAFFMFNANKWFGKEDTYFAPLLFLMLFTTSAFISALIVGAYPFILYFNKNQKKDAIKLLFYTAGFLVLFVILGILSFILF